MDAMEMVPRKQGELYTWKNEISWLAIHNED